MSPFLTLSNPEGGVLHFGFRSPMLSEELDYAGKVALAKEVGAGILEPQLVEREFKDIDAAHRYRDVAEAASIRIPSLGCELGLTTAQDQADLKARVERVASFAGALGATHTFARLMPPPPDVPQSETWQTVARQGRLAANVLADAGIKLAIEADGPSFAPSLERLERAVKLVAHPNCYANYDPTNLYLGGSDPLLALTRLGDRIVSGHIKDGIYRTGKREEVPVGTGDLDYPCIFKHLLALGRPINLYVEHCKTAESVRRSFESLRNLIGPPLRMNPPPPSSPSPRKPNIIWLFGDQHRRQALGLEGDPNVQTPHIDELAATGVNFRNAVAGTPLCTPFRGSLLTSRYPHECCPEHNSPMPDGQQTIAHAFRAHDYHTAYFGKWHVDGNVPEGLRSAWHIVPPERRGGFDEWLGYENNNLQFDSWVHGTSHKCPVALPGYETDALTDLFIDFLQRQKADRPFFAALSVQPPHAPYVAPEKWTGRHRAEDVQLRGNVPAIPRLVESVRTELAGYYAMIENWDWNVGRIRAALQKTGLAEDTIILFFSDHGDMHGSHGHIRKTTPWAESVGIPFIVSGPRTKGYQTGETTAPINHVDIAPTSLGLCGLPVPAWMRGHNYAGCYTGESTKDPMPHSAFMQYMQPTRGQTMVFDRPWRGVVTADGWKYVALEHQPWLLFDLNEDPLEQSNLAHLGFYHKQRARLHEYLRDWMAKTDDHEFQLGAG